MTRSLITRHRRILVTHALVHHSNALRPVSIARSDSFTNWTYLDDAPLFPTRCISSSQPRTTASSPHHSIVMGAVLDFVSYSLYLFWKSLLTIHTLPSLVYKATALPEGEATTCLNGPLSSIRSSASVASTTYNVLSTAKSTSTVRDRV